MRQSGGDEQARRPGTRPQTLSGRQPRLNLDSLAIGGPLTAALVGLLVTEGDAAFGNAAADAAGDGSATHRAQEEESAASPGSGQTSLDDAGPQGLARAAGASTSGEILDPVAAEAAAALAATSGTAAAGTLAPPNGTAAGSDGDTIVSGDTSITLGAAPLEDLGGSAAAPMVMVRNRMGASERASRGPTATT